MKNKGEFLSQLSLMLGELSGDMTLCEKGMQQAQSSWRRLYVRSTFTSIEGLTCFLKQHSLNNRLIDCYDSFKNGTPDLPLRELSLLQEESYTLKDNGRPKTAKAKLRTVPNLLFALTSFAESIGSEYSVEKDQGYGALKDAILIRDRLTHPKDLESLTVTDDELRILKDAFGWVRRELTRIIENTPGAKIEQVAPPNIYMAAEVKRK
jgi:hypothetical protein